MAGTEENCVRGLEVALLQCRLRDEHRPAFRRVPLSGCNWTSDTGGKGMMGRERHEDGSLRVPDDSIERTLLLPAPLHRREGFLDPIPLARLRT
jgi:hypothetical protein